MPIELFYVAQQIYNLLTKLDNTFNLGDQLKIEQRIGEIYFEKIWLVLFKEEDISKGYNKYKLMLKILISSDNKIRKIAYPGSEEFDRLIELGFLQKSKK